MKWIYYAWLQKEKITQRFQKFRKTLSEQIKIIVFRILLSLRYRVVFETISVFKGSILIKNRSSFTHILYLKDENGESRNCGEFDFRNPKRVPYVSNDVDRLRKFEGKICFEFVRVLLYVSPHHGLFNREANYKPKGISLLDWMFMLANNARGQWSWYTNFVDIVLVRFQTNARTAINFSIKK